MPGLYMGQAFVLSEHEDKVQNRYKEKTYQSDISRHLVGTSNIQVCVDGTSIKAEAKLNFASPSPVAWTDYNFMIFMPNASLAECQKVLTNISRYFQSVFLIGKSYRIRIFR